MTNDLTQAARDYHEGTKHPGGNLLNPYHRFTARDRPYLFKAYENLDSIPLPVDKSARAIPALQAIAEDGKKSTAEGMPDRQAIARLLYFSAGITKRIDYGPPVGEILFRAASCTGALYHIELYVVCAELPDLPAGVYHYDPRDNALQQLRTGDYRQHLVEATAGSTTVESAPVLLLFSSIFWRNAVKYQARAYRHAFWDSGTILSQTLAMSAAQRLPASVVLGFVDETANRLLGLDGDWEAVLGMVAVGRTEEAPPAAPELEPLALTVKPILAARDKARARRLIQPIQAMHQASSLETPAQVAAWRGEPPPLQLPEVSHRALPLFPPSAAEMADDPLATVIKRRGSSRRFRQQPIAREQLAAIVQQAIHGFQADFTDPPPLSLCHAYLIANAVTGLPAGAYVYRREQQELELLKEGQFRREAGELALGQPLGRDAAVNVYFLTELAPLLSRFGNRGYRAAQLEASVAAGRIYLAAYAQKLGATGLTFYDDGVTEFFSPHAADKSVLFLMAIGIPA